MARQLTLPLPARAALGREDYFVSPANAIVLETVDAPDRWPGGKLALVGPPGAGKTHLAHVFAATAGADVVGADVLDTADPDSVARGPLVIDDADRCADAHRLLHLYNRMSERRYPLLLTGATPPARWPVSLPDLSSRLATIAVAELPAPDDALLTAVLAKHFADRQIAPPPTLIPYLVARMERSLGAAGRIVDRLDRVAMTESRPIGRALAARILDIPGETGD